MIPVSNQNGIPTYKCVPYLSSVCKSLKVQGFIDWWLEILYTQGGQFKDFWVLVLGAVNGLSMLYLRAWPHQGCWAATGFGQGLPEATNRVGRLAGP